MLWITVALAAALAVALSFVFGLMQTCSKIVRCVRVMLGGQWWTTRELKQSLSGSPYNVLLLLEREGIVESKLDENITPEWLAARGGIPRRLYRLKYHRPGQ